MGKDGASHLLCFLTCSMLVNCRTPNHGLLGFRPCVHSKVEQWYDFDKCTFLFRFTGLQGHSLHKIISVMQTLWQEKGEWMFNATCPLSHSHNLFPSSIIIIIINPLTMRVAGAPQMILQPVFSIFPCSTLPSGTCQTPGLSIPWCCLPTPCFVCLVFFPLALCLARWFWPDLMNGKHDHTTAVCVSLQLSGDLPVVQLPAGSWHGLPRW